MNQFGHCLLPNDSTRLHTLGERVEPNQLVQSGGRLVRKQLFRQGVMGRVVSKLRGRSGRKMPPPGCIGRSEDALCDHRECDVHCLQELAALSSLSDGIVDVLVVV